MTVHTSKVRIYDLAKDLRLDSKRLIEELKREGANVKFPSNSISHELAERMRNKYYPKAPLKKSVVVRELGPSLKLPAAAAKLPPQQTRFFIVDGLNVCMWGQPPSLAYLLVLLLALAQRGHSFLAIFDATARHRLANAQEVEVYDQLLKQYANYFSEVPRGKPADEFILMLSDTSGDHIISNDHFREYVYQYNWLGHHSPRLNKGTVAGKRLLIPDLHINVPVGDLGKIVQDFVPIMDSIKHVMESDPAPELEA